MAWKTPETNGNGQAPDVRSLASLNHNDVLGCPSCGVERHLREFRLVWVTSLMAVAPLCVRCWDTLIPKRRLRWFMLLVDGWMTRSRRPEEIKRMGELRQLIKEAVEREGEKEEVT